MSSEPLEFKVFGHFDAAEAQRLRASIDGLPQDQPVLIDFGHADVPSICTLTTFVDALTRLPRRLIELRGLSRQDLVLLRYCGLDLDALGLTHFFPDPRPLADG